MVPKTKYDIKVDGLRKKLAPITDLQKQWSLKKAFPNDPTGYFNKRKLAWCHECGHSWKLDACDVSAITMAHNCPGCGRAVGFKQDSDVKHLERDYVGVIQTFKGFQVIRFLFVEKMCWRGQAAKLSANEVMQHWIDESGRVTVFALETNQHQVYVDMWRWSSEMELRGTNSGRAEYRHNMTVSFIYPKPHVLPIFKRNGFDGKFYGYCPTKVLTTLIEDPIAETLIKAGQKSMYDFYLGCSYKKDFKKSLWPSVKICIRNGYIIQKHSIWRDYFDLLKHFKMDVRNSKLICPDNLKLAHDELVSKKNIILQRQIEENRRRREAADLEKARIAAMTDEEREAMYAEQKSRFFNLKFSDGVVAVQVLKSISEFKEEGDELKHCVHTNDYYLKRDSLVLSARIEGKRVETIEINLASMKITQAYGWDNKVTPHHDRIVKLVSKYLPKIAQLARSAS